MRRAGARWTIAGCRAHHGLKIRQKIYEQLTRTADPRSSGTPKSRAADTRRAGLPCDLARAPALAECWYNLAVVQRLLGRTDAALASYREALKHGVSRPEEVHLNRAVIYADVMQRDQQAEAELREALRLNPTYLPAMLNLANLHEDRGQRDEARALYGEVLAHDPLSFLAFARLSNLQPRGSHDAALIERLRAAIQRPEASAAHRAQLGFALGRALDGLGDYPGAFIAYEAANGSSRGECPQRGHL